mmetsp:Transcript_61052/g.72489  ORF Transcript_61052/g.72489 Transcript_61052/m.72489 type:complete len:625 (-) Transcript_61052:146-2020(-)|eukprot:CAMPEP_0172500538 /NCGR_PEP_ID=MMETSP1066-20121228/139757_1 /TAXON_ID=671091 /ORGANISM="Coscinodiscus wailesii, Strain CCMP2513" /LENGTH=624 /DNA_ID=CAMNT_0013274823 /DNA_START=132 /DNA_END=2006 /DNA_ORIENTATION=+
MVSRKKIASTGKEESKFWTSVGLPNDDLEKVMWGKEGLPPPTGRTSSSSSSSSIVMRKSSSQKSDNPFLVDGHDVFSDSDGEEGMFMNDKKNDNGGADIENGLMDIVWKQRSGFGKLSMYNWEQRLLVLDGGRLLYFKIDEEGNPVSKSRGQLDLRCSKEDEEKVTVETKGDGSAPLDFEIIVKKGESVTWRFAFDSGLKQKKWLVAIMEVLGEDVNSVMNGDGPFVDHGLIAGDHIIRWEFMALPIGYPIQIHGIVLEAGKNCVIIADFGMTSYYQNKGQDGTGKDSTGKDGGADILNEPNKDSDKRPGMSTSATSGWDVLGSKNKQRLNVIALTDPKEIKKWSKINYGRNLSKDSFFSGWFGKGSKDESNKPIGLKNRPDWASVESSSQPTENETDIIRPQINEPDWFRENVADTIPNKPQTEPDPPSPRVFNLAPDEKTPTTPKKPTSDAASKPEQQKLPKSDPPKIVLARTNFLLEFGESILPPYHVFYANSECIAVWCKTGRWSTLQTAVFLHATAIGNAKSATALTISLAAVNVALIPVMAVGGIAAVTAPWYILKKSREKTEDATRHLTNLFWAWAPNEVFVTAVECWSGLLGEEERMKRYDEVGKVAKVGISHVGK